MKSAIYIKKNIKTLVLILCLNLIQLTPKSVLAAIGTDGGGGGVGLVCDLNTASPKVLLVDLWENSLLFPNQTVPTGDFTNDGQMIYKDASELNFSTDDEAIAFTQKKLDLMLPKNSILVQGQIRSDFDQLIKQYKNLGGPIYENGIRVVYTGRNTLVNQQGLKLTADFFPVLEEPEGCKYTQLVNYTASGFVQINKALVDLMTPAHRIALFAHEAVYLFERERNMRTNSEFVRNIIGQLFYGQPIVQPFSQLPENYYSCKSDYESSENGLWTSLKLYTRVSNYPKIGDKAADFEVLSLFGKWAISKTRGWLVTENGDASGNGLFSNIINKNMETKGKYRQNALERSVSAGFELNSSFRESVNSQPQRVSLSIDFPKARKLDGYFELTLSREVIENGRKSKQTQRLNCTYTEKIKDHDLHFKKNRSEK